MQPRYADQESYACDLGDCVAVCGSSPPCIATCVCCTCKRRDRALGVQGQGCVLTRVRWRAV
jgi:hypothetical protein